jgi:hypothetical protein
VVVVVKVETSISVEQLFEKARVEMENLDATSNEGVFETDEAAKDAVVPIDEGDLSVTSIKGDVQEG